MAHPPVDNVSTIINSIYLYTYMIFRNCTPHNSSTTKVVRHPATRPINRSTRHTSIHFNTTTHQHINPHTTSFHLIFQHPHYFHLTAGTVSTLPLIGFEPTQSLVSRQHNKSTLRTSLTLTPSHVPHPHTPHIFA
jgi:hypothetical protein